MVVVERTEAINAWHLVLAHGFGDLNCILLSY